MDGLRLFQAGYKAVIITARKLIIYIPAVFYSSRVTIAAVFTENSKKQVLLTLNQWEERRMVQPAARQHTRLREEKIFLLDYLQQYKFFTAHTIPKEARPDPEKRYIFCRYIDQFERARLQY